VVAVGKQQLLHFTTNDREENRQRVSAAEAHPRAEEPLRMERLAVVGAA
jgi:hypothetical protein